MTEPVSTSVATYFSVTKLWSIIAGVCGSIIPILALADKQKIKATSGFFMAMTGSNVSIFVGPWLAQRMGFTSMEGTVALSWILGVTGVFIVRAVIKWIEDRGVETINNVVNRAVGNVTSNRDDSPVVDKPTQGPEAK